MTHPQANDTVLARLVADLRPVRPLHLRRRLLGWLFLQGLILAVVASQALRPDIAAALHGPAFVIELAVLLSAGGVSAWLAVRTAFPARSPSWRLVGAALALAGVGLILFAAHSRGPDMPAGAFAAGARCLTMTVTLAALPWLVLVALLVRGAPVAPARAGALAGAASLLFAAAGARVACALDDPVHLMVWHGLPVVLGVGLSGVLGAAWLGRWARAR